MLTHLPSVALHTETSHLFCTANQKTDFQMKRNTGLKWAKMQITAALLKRTSPWIFKCYFPYIFSLKQLLKYHSQDKIFQFNVFLELKSFL